ncbi:hypothetical protein BDV95DRAFT_109139 [Massariosphaeria phaeospora]|uniref:Uncharacterized protein n=1 Tax=Massariosphaeria phaeospora TaxID=100035 RepID=A0A7C8I483_9PLEO|nr:hypothetical protein BDV95DRAFT_109139 [Massariosphaeria phaeospora]
MSMSTVRRFRRGSPNALQMVPWIRSTYYCQKQTLRVEARAQLSSRPSWTPTTKIELAPTIYPAGARQWTRVTEGHFLIQITIPGKSRLQQKILVQTPNVDPLARASIYRISMGIPVLAIRRIMPLWRDLPLAVALVAGGKARGLSFLRHCGSRPSWLVVF